MSDFLELLSVAPPGNSSASGILHSLSLAASPAGAGSNHLAGLAQLAVLALLAFPIWLFGLLIGLLLPKGTFSVSSSQSADDTDANSSTSSREAAGISSRPLSNDELSDSESEYGDDADRQPLADALPPASASKYDTSRPIVSSGAVKPATGLSAAGRMFSAAAGRASHTVAWAQQLVGQQQGPKYLSPSGPPTPDASYTGRASIQSPDKAVVQQPPQQGSHHHKHHQHHHRHQQHATGRHAFAGGATGAASGAALRHSSSGSSGRSRSFSGPHSGHHWFVTEDDLGKFTSTLAPVQDRLLTGNIGPEWSLIMNKEVPGVVKYLSYMRPTENGTTDYLSVTILPDATAQEVHEFNLDDACRCTWDPMLNKTWLLSNRDVSADEQLVIWLRSFPMGFLSDRLYAGIARRTFPDPQQPRSSLFGVTKVVKAPAAAAWAAEHYPGVIQTDNYFSAWRCRTIPSPWDETPKAAANSSSGSIIDNSGMPQLTIKTGAEASAAPAGGFGGGSKPACELILLHHDELKVPEYLSRMAIKVGMWKFVTGMVDAAGTWLEQRRTRCDPFQEDPQAACKRTAPPLSGAAAAAAAAAAVPESPFSPLARQRLGPSAGAVGSAVAVNPASEVDAADLLMSPRRLYAVPTAPDLKTLDTFAEDDQESIVDGLATPLARPVSFSESGGLARKSPGLRRGHSLEWEPRPDVAAVVSTPAATAKGVGAASTTVTAHLQEQQQQRKFGFGPIQLSFGVPQQLKAVSGVPGAVQNAASRLPGAVSNFFRNFGKPAGSAEAGQGAAVSEAVVAAAAASHSGANVRQLKVKVPGRDGVDAGGVAKSGGPSGGKVVRLAANGDQDGVAAAADQSQQEAQQQRQVKRLRTQQQGKLQQARAVALRGAVVCAAVGIVRLLAGPGHRGGNTADRKPRQIKHSKVGA